MIYANIIFLHVLLISGTVYLTPIIIFTMRTQSRTVNKAEKWLPCETSVAWCYSPCAKAVLWLAGGGIWGGLAM